MSIVTVQKDFPIFLCKNQAKIQCQSTFFSFKPLYPFIEFPNLIPLSDPLNPNVISYENVENRTLKTIKCLLIFTLVN